MPIAKAAVIPTPAIPDAEAALVVDAFRVNDRFFARGERLRRDDPIVTAHPEMFRTPALRLDE